jgi:NAD(P)-dependent dehydrogenase (short-subunit alcohol dehydrogenase family)
VCTTSTSGLAANPGQSNYGAAKAGVAAFTLVAAAELAQYGVRVNAIAPLARTRLTEAVPALREKMAPPADPDAFDPWHPANVAPMVAWLASPDCEVTGRVFVVHGGTVQLFRPWSLETEVQKDGRWAPADLGYSVMSRILA